MSDFKEEKVTFVSFDTKEGTSTGKDGKQRSWVLYLMKTADGRVFSTFDTNFAKVDTEFEIRYTEKEDGDFVNRRIISPDKPKAPESSVSVDYDKVRKIVREELAIAVEVNVSSLRTATKFIINHLTKALKDSGETITDAELDEIGEEV